MAKKDEAIEHDCPSYCHPCPYMLNGGIMPMCMGTATAYYDEYDLTHCTCDPSDPRLTRILLGKYALRGIEQLRDWRRFRRVQASTVRSLETLALKMAVKVAGGNHRDIDAWKQVLVMVRNFKTDLRRPASDQLDERCEDIRTETRRDFPVVLSFLTKRQRVSAAPAQRET